jgi:hypothetical protein
MAREFKYYSSAICLYGASEAFHAKCETLTSYYYRNRGQYDVVCKAKSLAEANRLMEAAGFGPKSFRKDYTSDTGNTGAKAAADALGIAIQSHYVRGMYFSVDQFKGRAENMEPFNVQPIRAEQ